MAAAGPYRNPSDPETAAKLMRRRTGNFTAWPAESITMDGHGSFSVRSDHYVSHYNGVGTRVGTTATDAEGFTELYNSSLARPGTGMTPAGPGDVEQVSDSRFRVNTGKDGWKLYTADGYPVND